MAQGSGSPMAKFLAKLVEDSMPDANEGEEIRISIVEDNARSMVQIPTTPQKKQLPARCRSVPVSPPPHLMPGNCGRGGDIVRVIENPVRFKGFGSGTSSQCERTTTNEGSSPRRLILSFRSSDPTRHLDCAKSQAEHLQLPLLGHSIKSPTTVMNMLEANPMAMNISPHLDVNLEACHRHGHKKQTVDATANEVAQEQLPEENQRLILISRSLPSTIRDFQF